MKNLILLFTICCVLGLSFCTSTKKTVADPKMDTSGITYSTSIAPIMQANCTPCHFPGEGKVTFLDTYGSVSKNIDGILFRIQQPVGADGFMPAGSHESLSNNDIQKFKDWKAAGMLK